MPLMYTDLHIHSAASPCADNDMTPNNITAMAAIKQLDMIAVCDHNSAANLPALSVCAKENGIALVPAIEANSKEEVHILCYFADNESCLKYSEYLYGFLPEVKADKDMFGCQYVMDADDEITGEIQKLLISPLNISAQQIYSEVSNLNGIAVFAHIDKKYNSVISNLGFIPADITAPTLEVSKNFELAKAGKMFGSKYRYITSSDAHILEDISERSFCLDLEEKSSACLVATLKSIIGG